MANRGGVSVAPRLSGFDLAAKRIEDATLRANPKLVLPVSSRYDPAIASAKDVADAVAAHSEQTKKNVHSAKSHFRTAVNSRFRNTGGGAISPKTIAVSDDPGTLRRSSRARSARSLDSSPGPSLRATAPPVPLFNHAFLSGSLAKPHKSLPNSITAPQYKRLLPSQIVRLSHESEIVVVVPTRDPGQPPHVQQALKYFNNKFDSLLSSTLGPLPASQKKEHLHRMKKTHELSRDGRVAHEFRCRVKNYPERATLSSYHLTDNDIRLMFERDIGINVEVCGYPLNQRTLIKFKHISAIEIYECVPSDSVLNDGLSFNPSGDIDEPLLSQLWLVRGCTSSSIELMMKYYQESSKRLQKKLLRLKRSTKKKNEEAKKMSEKNDTAVKRNMISLLQDELTEDRMYSYASWVDSQYKDRFRNEYSTWSSLIEFLAPCSLISQQYLRF